jgi:hypothetical protein
VNDEKGRGAEKISMMTPGKKDNCIPKSATFYLMAVTHDRKKTYAAIFILSVHGISEASRPMIPSSALRVVAHHHPEYALFIPHRFC